MMAAKKRARSVADPLIGATLSERYEIVEVLGEGGAGVVYGARERRLGRAVAVKVLGARAPVDATAIKRFRRECVAISQLGHPSIVDVYDVGRLDDGRPYLVMPRLRGRNLAQIRREDGRFRLERVVELLAGPAAALDLVHHAGIIHRDIKPANLVLDTLPTGEEIVRIVDFGYAWLDEGAARLTREGHVVGTARYISPEAARGESVDRRADVYSFACTVFELVAGEVPIDATSSFDVLVAKTRVDAPRLSSLVEVPEAVDDAIARALSRDPEARQATVGELYGELRRGIGLEAPRAEAPVGGAGRSVVVDPELDAPRRASPQRALATEVVPRLERPPAPAPKASDTPNSASIEIPMTRPPWRMGAILVAVALFAIGALVFGSHQADEAPRVEASLPTAEPTPVATPIPPPAPPAAPTPTAPEPVAVSARGVPSVPSPARPASPTDEGAPVVADPAAAARLTEAGTRALLEGLVPEAVRRFSAATIAAPRHAPAWRGLGLANQRLGRPAEARRAYEHYLALAPHARDADAIRARMEGLR